MNRLEDIRKILELVKTNECSVGRAIHQIYSLFELEFNNALEADAHNWDTRELTKPNESRLLDEDEILDIWTKNKEDCGMVTDFARKVISNTASIVRAKTFKEVRKELMDEVMPNFTKDKWQSYWKNKGVE